MESTVVCRSKFQDSLGRPVTQSLFLEFGYNDAAIYTLKDYDYDYEGKKLPSIKRLYLEAEDVTEYEFANAYFLSYDHWLRICNMKIFKPYVEKMRTELELKLKARAMRKLIEQADAGNFQAAKLLVDKGYEKRIAGRPSKEEVERQTEIQRRISDEFSADIVRLREA